MWMSYTRLPSFKGLLFIIAIGMAILVVVYTNGIVEDLRAQSRRHLTVQVDRFRLLFMQNDAASLDAYLKEMAEKDFPVIVTDADGKPTSWSGLAALDSMPFAEAVIRARELQEEWVSQGNDPVPFTLPEYGVTVKYYYGDSDYIRKLQYIPWGGVTLVGTLVLIAYFGFTSIKKSEERSVWVGMAREAAHQLGTPLTSLMGWNEILRDRLEDKSISDEIEHDITRLSIVADRFNKIGSMPSLTDQQLLPIIEEAADYIRRRLPQLGGNEVDIKIAVPTEITISINRTLFGWALENMLKNSVEALHGKTGKIQLSAKEKGSKLILDLTDTGCGIPGRRFKDIFRPGFTTKKRGWGLGLSLVKRIISEVHRGKIYVLDSIPDRETTIRIVLPLTKRMKR